MDKVACISCYRVLEKEQAEKEGWLIRKKALTPHDVLFVLCEECLSLNRTDTATLDEMDDKFRIFDKAARRRRAGAWQ